MKTSRTSAPLFLGALMMVMFVGAIVVHYAEYDINTEFRAWGDCFYWMMVTMSTTGYGDIVPITAGGRAMASIAMVAGPGLLASFAASVIATFYDEWQRGAKGMAKITSREHIIICGWNTTAKDVIAELRQSEVFIKTPVTVIDAGTDTNPSTDSRTTFVHGVPSEVKALEQANISEAKYAIVIAKDKTTAADQQTVLTVLAIKNINSSVHVCAEVTDVNNEIHLRRAGCDTIVNTSSLTGGLLACSLINPSVGEVIKDLASFQGNEVYRVQLPKRAEQRKFVDMLSDYKKTHDAVVIGIEREGKTLLNPSANLELNSADYLLVVAEECPR